MLTLIIHQKHLFYKAFVIYVYSRRKGGNRSYKYIGKTIDGVPGCTQVVVVVISDLIAGSCNASALLINTNKDDCQHGACLHRDSFLIVKCKYIYTENDFCSWKPRSWCKLEELVIQTPQSKHQPGYYRWDLIDVVIARLAQEPLPLFHILMTKFNLYRCHIIVSNWIYVVLFKKKIPSLAKILFLKCCKYFQALCVPLAKTSLLQKSLFINMFVHECIHLWIFIVQDSNASSNFKHFWSIKTK